MTERQAPDISPAAGSDATTGQAGRAAAGSRATLSADVLDEMRRTRRHPRITQFDYLHLHRLVEDLAVALRTVPPPVDDVLDAFCGTRPYDDLLPPGARCVGMDIDDHYGAVDVVSHEFLPFEDDSFDLVMSIEAFHFVPDPEHGVAEIRRVLRARGTALITIPFVWEYDRDTLEHRYTGPELERLFAGWDDVRVLENGSRGVVWAILTGRLINFAEGGSRRHCGAGRSLCSLRHTRRSTRSAC